MIPIILTTTNDLILNQFNTLNMRKLIMLFMLAFLFTGVTMYGQEETEKQEKMEFVSIGAIAGDGIGFYFMMEFYRILGEKHNISLYAKGANIYDVSVKSTGLLTSSEYKGKGYTAAMGSRSYFSENTGRGFFYANELKYSTVKFDDVDYKGTYSYFSFFAPELGWKVMFGQAKRFGLEISGGVDWAIEIKGKGDVDNVIFDNWKPKASLGFGYSF